MRFEELDETVTFYIGPLPLPKPIPPPPPPPPGPIGATLGTAMNNFNSSPKKVSTHCNLTVLLLDLEKFEICMLLALEGPPLGPPGGHMYTIWTTLNPRPLRMIPAKFG